MIKPGSCIRLHPLYPHLWEYLEVITVQEMPNDIFRIVGQEVGLDSAGSRGKRITLYVDKERYELFAKYAITSGQAASNAVGTIVGVFVIVYILSLFASSM